VTFEVILEDVATHQATRFLADDPHGLNQVFDALDDLSEDPARPDRSRSAPMICAGFGSAAIA
jgi:hypothetical protein